MPWSLGGGGGGVRVCAGCSWGAIYRCAASNDASVCVCVGRRMIKERFGGSLCTH